VTRQVVTIRKASGHRIAFWLDSAAEATDVGATTGFGWDAVEESLALTKSFRWQLSRAREAGETVTTDADATVRTLTLLVVGGDNAEGWGDTADAPALTYPRRLSPYTYPYDESIAVPRAPNYVGPALLLADRIVGRGQYARATIISVATAGATIGTLYGTTGDDGLYATERDIPAVCGGKEGSNPAPLLLPGDDYMIVLVSGETDAVSPPADWSASALQLVDHICANDFPSSNCVAVLVAQLPPSAPDNGDPSTTHPGWQTIRTEQAQLEDRAAAPKRILVPLADGDRITTDRQRIATGATARNGWRRFAFAAETELVAAGAIR